MSTNRRGFLRAVGLGLVAASVNAKENNVMKPDLPDCPDKREDCRFTDMGGNVTCLYSPISYDRSGNPVGGGNNVFTRSIICGVCGRHWTSAQTELADLQGKKRAWEPFKR